MKTFEDLLAKSVNLSIELVNNQLYFAHIQLDKNAETLPEHTTLVAEYAKKIVKEHGLEICIDKLVEGCGISLNINNKDVFYNRLKQLFVDTIVFHDFGKSNENFQVDRMNNSYFSKNKKTLLVPAYGHSFLGSYLFLVSHLDEIIKDEIDNNEKSYLVLFACFFSYIIDKHHSSSLECATSERFFSSFSDKYDELNKYIRLFGFRIDKQIVNVVLDDLCSINDIVINNGIELIHFPLYALIKLCYSLLTTSDYLATHEYMNDSQTDDLGVINDVLRKKELISNLRNFEHNVQTFSSIENYQFIHPTEKSTKNLNILRKEMAIELIQTIRKNSEQRLFYIEAPTGGGKTNMSMIALGELLQLNQEINKVFYVFPFTTLITQTYYSLKKTFGLTNSELVELHSKAPLNNKSDDDEYGDKRKNFIDNLFALYPITVLSHVKFFDILKTNKKESNYLLHRIANSVVIIDELQSYNPAIWDMMLYFINEYAEYFNIRFILMSATLPKIGLLDIKQINRPDFVELLPDAKRYLSNPNFANRVSFKFDLFRKEIDLPSLADFLIEKSFMYKSKNNGSVFTIIEFIFKKSASDMYQILDNKEHPFDEVFVLSGTILESRRKEIINYIKNPLHRSKSLLLITTQVVEAGVDIDMDLGFKNISLIDSDEQLAGRVNRNAGKENSEVYLFRLNDASVLYKGDDRYKVTREFISESDYQDILNTKNFSKLYNLVFNVIDERNNMEFIQNFYSEFLRDGIYSLDYLSVDNQFKIISQNNQSVFVPMNIPLKIASAQNDFFEEEIFTKEELSFLEKFEILPVDGALLGEDVWYVYESLIMAKKKIFDLQDKVDFKILQGIMSKFSFSLISNAKDIRSILDGFGEEKYGYIYFSYWNEERTDGIPYSYLSGLNANAFSDIQFI